MSNELKKQISLYSLTMIAIGSSIGSGIFRTPSEIAYYLPSEGLMLSVWIVGGLIALCGALTFAKIAEHFSQVGGFYVYLKETYGNLPAFLYGWSMLVVINTGSLAALSLVFTTYLKVFFNISENAELIIAILAITLLTLMNVVGVKLGSLFASIFTSAKLLGIISVVLIGFFWGTNTKIDYFNIEYPSNSNNLSLISALGLALIGVSFSYGGYQHATFIASEVKDASKIVPKALIIGILAVCFAYLTINFAYLKLIPINQMVNSNSVASDAISTIWSLGSKFISFLIVLSVLGTIGIYILTAPRIYFAMSDDKLFFKKFAEIHPKYHTPFWAIIFQSIWTIFLLIFWKTFSNLITYVVFVDTLFFLLAATTYFKLIKNKTFIGKMIASIFIAMCLFIVLNTLIEKPQQAFAGVMFLGIGSIVFQIFKNKSLNI
ncbi:amino acid permease-associated region [Emticicia oligotrophica DSM 17448]|uniref:Amino acid permease-associated region n=1 Tax=Emticicia oligotrophica (strain DSM 17448 / CIP 109782 / MTCC 6937 / GPTSA100-15) TaxID=929562 RepID=A0ABN4AS83_EMTOG|nr:amino acid permease [Emticicia oligotrophica]AFK05349.1 amino acid permease-associated region [Emticicia oligotrophica DSM 17448]